MTTRTYAKWLELIVRQIESARTELPRVVAAVPTERWDAPSQNEGWAHRHVLAHIVDTAQTRNVALRAAIGREQLDAARFGDVAARDGRIEKLCALRIDELLGSFEESLDGAMELLSEVDPAAEGLRDDGLAMTFGDGMLYFASHELAHIGELRAVVYGAGNIQ